jgi:hypothetical protein
MESLNDQGEFSQNDGDKGIKDGQENQNFSKIEENSTETLQSYSILDIEEFLKNGKIPPGIKEYDDLPSLESCKPSES